MLGKQETCTYVSSLLHGDRVELEDLLTTRNNRKPCPLPVPHLKHFSRLISPYLEYRCYGKATFCLGTVGFRPHFTCSCHVPPSLGRCTDFPSWRGWMGNGAQIIPRATRDFQKSGSHSWTLSRRQRLPWFTDGEFLVACSQTISNTDRRVSTKDQTASQAHTFCSPLMFVLSVFRKR